MKLELLILFSFLLPHLASSKMWVFAISFFGFIGLGFILVHSMGPSEPENDHGGAALISALLLFPWCAAGLSMGFTTKLFMLLAMQGKHREIQKRLQIVSAVLLVLTGGALFYQFKQ